MKNKRYFFNGLTFVAGFINIFAVSFIATPVSHHTGNLTQTVFSGSRGDLSASAMFFSAVVLYFLGAFVDGLLFEGEDFDKKAASRVLVFLTAGFFTLGVVGLFASAELYFLLFAPFALGMQNAVVIRQNGVVIRTTHMTGYLTDAAYLIGQRIKGVSDESGRIDIFLQGILFFFLGGVFYLPLKKVLQDPAPYLLIIAGMYLFLLVFLQKKAK